MRHSTGFATLALFVLLIAFHPSAGAAQTRDTTDQGVVLHNVEVQKVAGMITTARAKNGRLRNWVAGDAVKDAVAIGTIESVIKAGDREVGRYSIRIDGLAVAVVDGEEENFIVCKGGTIAVMLDQRPELFYRAAQIAGNTSRYRLQQIGDLTVFLADRPGEQILLPVKLASPASAARGTSIDVQLVSPLVPLPSTTR